MPFLSTEELTRRAELCDPCDSEYCAYAYKGLCCFPLVFGEEPDLTDDDCCAGYVYDERRES